MAQQVKDQALSLLWLWLLAPSLAWELPHATGVAKKRKKRRDFTASSRKEITNHAASC